MRRLRICGTKEAFPVTGLRGLLLRASLFFALFLVVWGSDELTSGVNRVHRVLIVPTLTEVSSYQSDYDTEGIPSGTVSGTKVATLSGNNAPTSFTISGTDASSFRMRANNGESGFDELELASTVTGAVSTHACSATYVSRSTRSWAVLARYAATSQHSPTYAATSRCGFLGNFIDHCRGHKR